MESDERRAGGTEGVHTLMQPRRLFLLGSALLAWSVYQSTQAATVFVRCAPVERLHFQRPTSDEAPDNFPWPIRVIE